MTNVAAYINFIETNEPIDALKTKFGGNPVWLEKASWPISRSTGKPMNFICQIAIDTSIFPNAKGKMAYIFMTGDEDGGDAETWDPESGENAVIIQPSHVLEADVQEIAVGPTIASEYDVQLKIVNDIAAPALESIDVDDPNYEEIMNSIAGNKIGGTPLFIQGDESPEGDDWVLLLQLDSTQLPFEINFGTCGVAYAFINTNGDKGKFLWQCG
ncbi:MAG: DUF1963 domain-containing protein [Alphaproteobacteria bacterium]|nr:DUF1963 domain-containing protein [Alphaproteobacteria bacterium]